MPTPSLRGWTLAEIDAALAVAQKRREQYLRAGRPPLPSTDAWIDRLLDARPLAEVRARVSDALS